MPKKIRRRGLNKNEIKSNTFQPIRNQFEINKQLIEFIKYVVIFIVILIIYNSPVVE
jgi:flagellar biosynthesis/type III secretory pathway M-ring protein FliF/YscJ